YTTLFRSLFVVFTVALLTATDLPYALAATVRSSAGQIIRPAHVLAAAALFMVILYETGRIPVETHSGTNEFDDRGSPAIRALWSLLRAAEVGFGRQAADLVHDLPQRVRRSLGSGRYPPGRCRRRRHSRAARQGLRARRGGVGHRQLVRQAQAVQDHRVRRGCFPARGARRVHALPRRWLMLAAQAPSVYTGAANVIAVLILLA